MIKETVDAVRVAEMEAEKTIATASANANDKKTQIKLQEKTYRERELKDAQNKAEFDMIKVKEDCEELQKNNTKLLNNKITDLKADALTKNEAGIKAIIDALV